MNFMPAKPSTPILLFNVEALFKIDSLMPTLQKTNYKNWCLKFGIGLFRYVCGCAKQLVNSYENIVL